VTVRRLFVAFTTVALLVSATATTVLAVTPGHRLARPNLIHAAPTHGQGSGAHQAPIRASLKTFADPGDDGTVDNNPTLSALCQSYIGGSNPYANPAPNVDQINGDTLVSAGSQTGCSAAQNETTISVNPRNPKNLVGGTNDYRIFNTREGRNDGSGWAYTTFDGGKTWTDVQLPHLTFQTGATGALSDMDSAGDPAVAFGPHNTVYYANLVFSRLNGGSGIVVSKSTNGGLTWGEPSIVFTDGVDSSGNPFPETVDNDKEWIGVDQRSGAVYVTWTEFGAAGSPIVASVSHNGGATWSAPVQVNPAFTPGGITPYSQGSIPQVGRDGTLYIAYEAAVCQSLNCDQPTDHDAIIVARSKDGGKTFKNVEASFDFDFPYNPHVGTETLTGENWRINSFPQFAVDPNDDRMYITWADDRNGQYDASFNSIKTNGDVFVISSGDGKKWSAPTRLGTSADEVYPAVATNDGRVAVSFYTRAYDPTGIGVDMAYVAGDGGALKKNHVSRITTQTENPNVQFLGVDLIDGTTVLQGEFIGDYTAVAMGSDGVFHPSWTDFRGLPGTTLPNQDAYTQAIRLH
jgi:hypothetical protein